MNINFIIVMGGIALLLIVLSAVSSIAQSNASCSGKTRWIALVALVPVVGWAAWWHNGPKRP